MVASMYLPDVSTCYLEENLEVAACCEWGLHIDCKSEN